MDTFMEKLAHRLTAQEMIRANNAAEEEELNNLKTQVKDYHECLDQMQNLVNSGTEQIRSLQSADSDSYQKLHEELQQLYTAVDAASEKASAQNAEAMESLKVYLEEKLAETLKAAQEAQEAAAQAAAQAAIEAEEEQQQVEFTETFMDEEEAPVEEEENWQEKLSFLFEAVDAAGEKTTAQNIQAIEALKQYIDTKFEQAKTQVNEEEAELKRQDELGLIFGAVDAAGENAVQKNIEAIDSLKSHIDAQIASLKVDDSAEEEDKIAAEFERLLDAVNANGERNVRLSEASMDGLKQYLGEKIEEGNKSSEDIESLKRFIEGRMSNLQQNRNEIPQLEANLMTRLDDDQEKIHKECVKVYRNVQAAMTEEFEKQNNEWAEKMKKYEKKMGMITAFAGISAVGSVVAAVFAIMAALHVF